MDHMESSNYMGVMILMANLIIMMMLHQAKVVHFFMVKYLLEIELLVILIKDYVISSHYQQVYGLEDTTKIISYLARGCIMKKMEIL
jgi:hypothetical protein